MTAGENPWLAIPAADYDAHMRAAGQAAVLRDLFGQVFARACPRRLALLGCTTCDDLAALDADSIDTVVGVDVNSGYLDIARDRWRSFGSRLHLMCADVMDTVLPAGAYDLVHAALLLEYVDASVLLKRIHGWLSPGGISSLVTQEPSDESPAVSTTGVRSLEALAGRMTLRPAVEVARLATAAGFRILSQEVVACPGGKRLVSSLLQPM